MCLLMPLGVSAGVAQCDRAALAHHVIESKTRNVGGGVVSYIESASIHHDGMGGNHQKLVIVGCRSRSQVSVGLSASRSSHNADGEYVTKSKYDVSDQAIQRFNELLDDTAAYTLEVIASELAVISPAVKGPEHIKDQPCGCAVAYPFGKHFENAFDLGALKYGDRN